MPSNSIEYTEPVKKTTVSLKNVHKALNPFLKILQDENNRNFYDTQPKADPQKLAEAEAAVALTLGTLRYVSSRLSGKKTDPGLKMELDKMKKIIVRLLKKGKKLKAKTEK